MNDFIYAKRSADDVIISNITATNLLPEGCERFYWPHSLDVPGGGGSYNYKVAKGAPVERTDTEKQSDAAYIEAQNSLIKSELDDIDSDSVRSLRAVVVALVAGETPLQADVDVLAEKEAAAKTKREKLK